VRISFEQPEWLLLLITLLPVVWLAWRSMDSLGKPRAIAACCLRGVVLLLLALALSRPSIMRSGEGVSVMVIADASRSVGNAQRLAAQTWLSERAKDRPRATDRMGVITVAKTPEIRSVPTREATIDIMAHAGDLTATDLSAGVRAAIAVMPSDTINRILLLSDGVETSGNIMEACARAAALGIPIDVVPMIPPNIADVMVESLRTPARARRGQVIDARVVLRSTQPAEGRLRIRVDDRMVDLDAASASDGLLVHVQAGPNAFSIPVPVDRSGAVRVQAFFEAQDPKQNVILENDIGSSITFVAGQGRVLIVDDGGGNVDALVQSIRESQLEAQVTTADGLGRSIAAGDFDGYVLCNMPRWSVDAETDRALHASVQAMGCGLMMLGGDKSFGAGGWNDSETAKALPVEMNPPQERKLPSGALALIIDCSGSMSAPVSGTNSSQQQIAAEAAIKAIRALSPNDQVTVIAFAFESTVVVPLTDCQNIASIESRIRAIESGGGTNLFPAMVLAQKQLQGTSLLTKHAIILTDGQTMGDPGEGLAIADRMAKDGITLSTVAIGDGSNDGLLARLAKVAGGRFYAVKDDQSRVAIPQIFIKEAQMVRRSLIWEGSPFTPVRVGSAEWMRSIASVPAIRGYVLTGPRGEPAQIGLVSMNEPADPILAWWNYGLGRAVAFTSDIGGKWSPAWSNWSSLQPFVGGMVRWMLRPTAPADIAVRSRLEGDEAIVEVESTGDAMVQVNSAEARVMRPDGSVQPLALRQVAAGRWSGHFSVDQAGAYLVNAALGIFGAQRPVFTQASVSVPYPREFRSAQPDVQQLQAIANRTGGRVITLGDPAAQLYFTDGVQSPESMRNIWNLCIALAAALFVVDVAVRRLAFDWWSPPVVESKRDTERVTAAWREVRQGALKNQRIVADSQALSGNPKATKRVEKSSESLQPVVPVMPAAPEASSANLETPEDHSPLGRLRAAKRRARGKGSS